MSYSYSIKDSWVTWTRIGHGVVIYALIASDFPCPIGLVWGIPQGGRKKLFQVYHSYTLPNARRQGVRTKINEAILQTFDAIVTGDGSKDGGSAFMAKSGYKRIDAIGEWYLAAAKPKRKNSRTATRR